MENRRNRLYRSQTDKVIAGICGGLGEYLNVNTSIVRLIWILMTLLGGSGIIIYIIAYFVIPLKISEEGETTQKMNHNMTAAKILGILFVIAGTAILLDNLNIHFFHRWWDMSWEYLLPSFLIIVGIYIMTKKNGVQDPARSQETMSGNNQTQEQFNTISGSAAMGQRVLRKSIMDKKFLGVCGGIGEYFDIDPTIVRIAYTVFTITSVGIGLLLYFLMYLIIPEGLLQPDKSK